MGRLRGTLGLAAAALLVFVAAVAAGYLTSRPERNPLPTPPASTASTNLVRGSILARNNDSLSIQTPDGVRDVRLSPSTRFEWLSPAGLDGIRPGDWANVGAVANRRSLFAITAIVLISPDILGGQR